MTSHMELTGGRTTIKLRRSGQVVLLSGAARRRSLSKGALHSQRNFQQGVFITHRRRRIEVTAGSSENAFSDGLGESDSPNPDATFRSL